MLREGRGGCQRIVTGRKPSPTPYAFARQVVEGLQRAGHCPGLYGLRVGLWMANEGKCKGSGTFLDRKRFLTLWTILNAEISLLIYDPQVVARLRKIQDRYFSEADLLSLDKWRRRPRLAKIVQNIARLVDALL